MKASLAPLLGPQASTDVRVVGGKAVGLARLAQIPGVTVPDGVVVPVGLIAAIIACDAVDDATAAALRAAVIRLGGRVAVRSSAIDEDGAQASFAGMHDTVLDVDSAGVVDAVLRCARSASSSRAAEYRLRRASDGGSAASIAVIVQTLVDADVAGVAFSADPVRRKRDRAIVEAVRGLGDRLVSGAVTGDRAAVDLLGRVVERSGADGAAGGETARVLGDALAIEVAAAARAVADAFGHPIDVEWAQRGGQLCVLQARAITTPLDDGPIIVWSNTNAKEILPDVCTPLAREIIMRYVRALLRPLLEPFGVPVDDFLPVGFVAGRAYFNVNGVMDWLRGLPGMKKKPPEALAQMLGGDAQALALAARLVAAHDGKATRLSAGSVLLGGLRVLARLLRHHRGDATREVAAMQAENRAAAAVDVDAIDDAALVSHVRALADTPWGDPHTDTASAAMVGMIAQQAFAATLLKRFPDEPGLASRLLSGTGALASAASGPALVRLAQRAVADGVQPLGAATAPTSSSSSSYQHALAAFLAEHGHHCRAECDVRAPRWSDDPAYVARMVQGLIDAGVAIDEEQAAARRAALFAGTLARVDPLTRALLRALEARARTGAAARENVKNEAVRRLAIVRRGLLALGRRLVARGAIDDVDDIFFCTFDDCDDVIAGGDLRPTIRTRRAQYARDCAEDPPDVVVGESYPRRVVTVPPEGALIGLAASAGVVDGIARVVLHEDDTTVVGRGEILVAPFTDPGWTPYFVQAAAVVTDFGGVLSHGAIIAREYGLPAVVNTGCATTAIKSGDRIRVDGDRGVVERLS